MQITPVNYNYTNPKIQKYNQKSFAGKNPIEPANELRTALSQIPGLNIKHIEEIMDMSELLPDGELLGLVNTARKAAAGNSDSLGIATRVFKFIDEYVNSRRPCD